MIQRNGLFVTECLSFPRSGHHLLTNLLQMYLGSDMVYHSLYESVDTKPITDPDSTVNYQKNHDFELATVVNPEIRYIVQIRDPIDSLDSWRALDSRTGALVGSPDDRALWESETRARLDYWRKFIDKWLISPVPNRLVIRYGDLLTRTEEVLVAAVQHLRGRQDIDYPKLLQTIQIVKPAPRPRYRSPFFFTA